MTGRTLTLPAFTVAPAADADRRGPGIIVVHEGNGMSAQLLRFSERLADQGYRVLAPDFFARSHDVDPNDFGAVIASITPANLKGDFSAAVAKSAFRFAGVIDPITAPKSLGSTSCERAKKSGAMMR